MKECGVYRVTGKREYRGHEQGTEFVAQLEPNAERRAVMRGSIERIGSTVPKPQNFTFPSGWLEPPEIPDHPRRREAPLLLKEE